MKKKHKKKHKITMNEPSFMNLAPMTEDIKLEISAIEDENSVYIKMSGFNRFDDVIGYSEYLAAYLPLLLYQTEVVH